MTIKASKDEGLTWPLGFQIMLNETIGFGYSCLSMVDEYTVGILYEGVKDIYFQKVPVSSRPGNRINQANRESPLSRRE